MKKNVDEYLKELDSMNLNIEQKRQVIRLIKSIVNSEGGGGGTGNNGTTFIPNVDINGNISWSNDGELPNPETRNIKGPKGDNGNPGKNGAPGKNGKDTIPEINHGITGTAATIEPNKLHIWGKVQELNLQLGTPISGVVNEYMFQFESGETATTLTLPSSIKWQGGTAPKINSNKTYQCSIINNVGLIVEV